MKNIVFAVALSLSCFARADYAYLSFLVDQASSENPIAFEYARVGVQGTDAYLNMQNTESSWILANTPYATSTYLANLAQYADPAYDFFVELYDTDFNPIGISSAVNYKNLSKYVATEMGQGGVTSSWTVSQFASVPEPTSGLLLLLGCGLLALRRKCVSNKLLTFSLFAFTFSFVSLGAANDTLLTFSTQGPDRYADGTVVADGECYALVWTKTGSAFAGFAADGSVVDGENNVLILAAPIAAGGRCPTTVFELNAKFAERYADGTYSLYLVDTRRANGRVGGVDAKGRPVVVNGYGKVKAKIEGEGGRNTAVVTTRSAVPEDAPEPVIKAMKVVGGNVYLTVSQTVPYLQYRVSGGATPDAAKPVGDAADGGDGGDIIMVVPATGSAGFFKVGRN